MNIAILCPGFQLRLERQAMVIKHLNQVQLADRWNISERTLERWRWTGEGPAYLKIGGRVVYRLEDIEAYEAENLRASTSATGGK
jgi:hypothetical protein